MPTVEEYHKGGGYYEFPDGTKKRGKEEAEEYFDSLDVEALFEEEEEEVVEEEVDTKTYLVKMRLPRVRYEEKGPSGKRYTFTKDHPLVVVEGADVDHFVQKAEFELATPEQAKEFYS